MHASRPPPTVCLNRNKPHNARHPTQFSPRSCNPSAWEDHHYHIQLYPDKNVTRGRVIPTAPHTEESDQAQQRLVIINWYVGRTGCRDSRQSFSADTCFCFLLSLLRYPSRLKGVNGRAAVQNLHADLALISRHVSFATHTGNESSPTCSQGNLPCSIHALSNPYMPNTFLILPEAPCRKLSCRRHTGTIISTMRRSAAGFVFIFLTPLSAFDVVQHMVTRGAGGGGGGEECMIPLS
ncbi:hypothetical protein F4778DRAFT_555769 [Xylariomycetidae sp. FL2044]|nr:hypothetical protein F4778DRAFT_555769 [Xylariomycetidae sp. FL2044]